MLRFLGRRILYAVLVYILIVFFLHLGFRMMRNSEISKPNYDLIRYSQLAWQDARATMSRMLQGDLGSIRTERGLESVDVIVQDAYMNSMVLLLVVLALSTVAGVLIGGITALVRRKVITIPLMMLTVLGISVPSFLAGLLLQLAELRYLDIFGRRLVSMAGFGWDLEHMLMPTLVLAARPLAYLTRTTFISVERVMQQDYIRTAFAKGLDLRQTVWVHALRNVAVPVCTAVGVSIRFSLSTLPVVEIFFAWPGMGRKLVEAINARQSPLVVALASMLGLTWLVTHLLLDIVYRVVDPRTRENG
jgi:glutathione transport system permease protein